MKLYYADKENKLALYNGDTLETMDYLISKGLKVDKVMTSPPYNNSRQHGSMENHEIRYDIHIDAMTNEDYIAWTIEIFKRYDELLAENGCILYNMSYGSENTEVMFLTIAEILKQTNFTIADKITWKKKSALPNNVSQNKLTRITEDVYVFCRESEFKTFTSNKQVKSKSHTGQKYYHNIFNFVDAKNNDGSCKLNKATYSSELCDKLFDIYAKEGETCLDNFNGSGTTGVSCINRGMKYYGIELSEGQCEFSRSRWIEHINNRGLF